MTPGDRLSRRSLLFGAFMRREPEDVPRPPARDDAPAPPGTAVIREPHCLPFMGTLCTVCSERCPVEGAIRLDVRGRPRVDASTCTGCGECRDVCPAPYNAVVILPAETGAPAATPDDRDAPPDWRREVFGDRSLKAPWSEG